jgi:deazaflavin-dependent oxidoreductase (nitroreductase family)
MTPRGTRGSKMFDQPPWVMRIMAAGNLGFFRLMGRRMRIQGQPLLLITTVGAKSGKRRQTPLASFPDEPARDDAWLIVASKGGSAAHPGWYVNLARRPDDVSIEIGGKKFAVTPESLHGPERERAWARVVALAPSYGGYAVATDREIPIVRLVRKR